MRGFIHSCACIHTFWRVTAWSMDTPVPRSQPHSLAPCRKKWTASAYIQQTHKEHAQPMSIIIHVRTNATMSLAEVKLQVMFHCMCTEHSTKCPCGRPHRWGGNGENTTPPGISDTTHLMTDEQRPSSDYVLTAGTWKSYSEWEGACRVKLDMWCALQLCLCMELR